MSDISFHFEWWEWLLASPIIGWPGLIGGAVFGAGIWRKRRIAGAFIGGLIGNFLVAAVLLMTK